MAAAEVAASVANDAAGVKVRPSVERNAIAWPGGFWTPTATTPFGPAPIPVNWFSARKWHGWHWTPGSSDWPAVTSSGWLTAAGVHDGAGASVRDGVAEHASRTTAMTAVTANNPTRALEATGRSGRVRM